MHRRAQRERGGRRRGPRGNDGRRCHAERAACRDASERRREPRLRWGSASAMRGSFHRSDVRPPLQRRRRPARVWSRTNLPLGRKHLRPLHPQRAALSGLTRSSRRRAGGRLRGMDRRAPGRSRPRSRTLHRRPRAAPTRRLPLVRRAADDLPLRADVPWPAGAGAGWDRHVGVRSTRGGGDDRRGHRREGVVCSSGRAGDGGPGRAIDAHVRERVRRDPRGGARGRACDARGDAHAARGRLGGVRAAPQRGERGASDRRCGPVVRRGGATAVGLPGGKRRGARRHAADPGPWARDARQPHRARLRRPDQADHRRAAVGFGG